MGVRPGCMWMSNVYKDDFGLKWCAPAKFTLTFRFYLRLSSTNLVVSSATRTRTRVVRVRAEYPDQLDHSGDEQNSLIRFSQTKRISSENNRKPRTRHSSCDTFSPQSSPRMLRGCKGAVLPPPRKLHRRARVAHIARSVRFKLTQDP